MRERRSLTATALAASFKNSWKAGVLADVIADVRGGFSVNSEDRPAEAGELGVLKTGAVLNSRFHPEEHKAVLSSEADRVRTSVSAGTIIICRKNSEDVIGASALVKEDYPSLFLSDLLWQITPSENVCLDWLAAFIASDRAKGLIRISATGTQASMKNISQDRLLAIPVPIPPLPEQRKIAEILRTWDEALEKLTALRAAKEKRLGALRYAMLFGELRLDDQRSNWEPTRLAAVTHELTTRNGAKGLGRYFVMGVTKAQGVVPMREQTIAGDISRYKCLPPRAFAYNPMRINVGSIAMNKRDEEVLVSPDYVVFACNADGLDPDYLDHLRKTSWWAHYINSGGSGSVRQRTYYDDLAALKLPLPELDEQKAIASVLNTARTDLAATEREIEALTRQKRGLMQKLLTGEWRVNSKEELK